MSDKLKMENNMQAAEFYTEQASNARLMKFVSQVDFGQMEGSHFGLQSFSGKVGEVAYFDEHVLIGTGKDSIEIALAQAVLKLKPGTYTTNQPVSPRAQLLWSLAQYRFDKFKTVTCSPRVLAVAEMQSLLNLANAIFLVRDLINTPAQDMDPSGLAEVAKHLAATYQAELNVCVGDDLLTAGYPAIHAVGRAAATAPRLIHLSWGNVQDPKVVLIGKGVCFDSGGLDIKSSGGMRLMKKDMGGAAHVLGLAQWIMETKLPIRLEMMIPAVENAVGPAAYRPGDVLRMRNGMTVEIENTDAEGRLVLADALVKACENKPELIIDFSTLTGAARVAVGTEIAAMFSHDEDLAEGLLTAGQSVVDPIWRLPLFEPYLSMLDSNIADIMNASNSSYAGAITAALFLQCFVDKSIPWAHFDIMAWNVTNKPGKPEGGEAMGLRAVADYLLKRFHG